MPALEVVQGGQHVSGIEGRPILASLPVADLADHSGDA